MELDAPNRYARHHRFSIWNTSVTLSICCLIVVLSGCGATQPNTVSSQKVAVQHQVDLSWDAPSSSPVEIVGYNVYRSPQSSSSYQRLNSSVDTETVYLDTLVQSGTSYNYFVTSVDGSGIESAPSDTVAVTIP